MQGNELRGMRIGVAMTGSFCTFKRAFDALCALRATGAVLYPIMSHMAYVTDTRFYAADEARNTLRTLCDDREIWHTIADVEPIGPKKLLDLLLVMPCTGSTLARLAHGLSDTPVSMASKSHLRNGRPLVLAVSTNDGLSGSAANIGMLLARKNVFFVPMYQDDPFAKPCSIAFDAMRLVETLVCAVQGQQMQPVLVEKPRTNA